MKWPSHGANVHYLYESLQLQMPHTYLDFSANLNPLGPPQKLKKKWNVLFEEVTEYPDPKGKSLTEKIASKEKIDEEWILLGNGGAELISLMGRLLADKKVLIVQPTFSEYEEACRINRCDISHFYVQPPDWQLSVHPLIKKASAEEVDAIILCNPNNPTGVAYSRETMVQVAEWCHENNVIFIVDEAFYDFVNPFDSLGTEVGKYANVVVLRSLTKMFAIPGLRLGYAVGHPSIIEQLAAFQPHWSVNGIALKAGELCLEEENFVSDTISYVKSERTRLFSFFENGDFEYSPSVVNFYLLQDKKNKDLYSLFQFLLKKGIVPRHTMNFPSLDGKWLRFAVKKEEENSRLMEVLVEWRRLHSSL